MGRIALFSKNSLNLRKGYLLPQPVYTIYSVNISWFLTRFLYQLLHVLNVKFIRQDMTGDMMLYQQLLRRILIPFYNLSFYPSQSEMYKFV